MSAILLSVSLALLAQSSAVLEERIDVYHPESMRYLGTERTWFDGAGARLRLEVSDSTGALTLLFVVRTDENGREMEAVYTNGDFTDLTREVFTYSAAGDLKVTTYFYEPGVAADRTESVLDSLGREVQKRYFRGDGSQYGEEDVLWFDSGAMRGWDFRYTERAGGTRFRYEYETSEPGPDWSRRVRFRDGAAERIEARAVVRADKPSRTLTPVRFAPGTISVETSESSPSFTSDGRTMVFARYTEDWTRKTAFLARLGESGWVVESLSHLGPVYNLAIAPNGDAIVFSRRDEEGARLFRTRRSSDGWSRPHDLTAAHGIRGGYAQILDSGALLYFDQEGPSGAGVYRADPDRNGFAASLPVFVPPSGTAFDSFLDDEGVLWVTRCFDDTCESEGANGIWTIGPSGLEVHLQGLPYAWGVQPLPALGLLVFTDGSDILAAPLLGVSPGN